MGERDRYAVERVGPEGAGLAAFVPLRREHEAIDGELRAAREEIGQRERAGRTLEAVLLLDPLPRHLPAAAGQRIALAGEFLPGGQQVETGLEPVLVRNDLIARGLLLFLEGTLGLQAQRTTDESDNRVGLPDGHREQACMDSLITAAARALAAGDPLGALNRVALREDAPALALRGIAMAQLGDFARAKALLRSAGRAFGPREAMARARCVVAEAEVALVSRDLGWPEKALDAACATLDAHGDRANAAQARYLAIRRLLLIGRLDEARRRLDGIDPAPLPPALRTVHELVAAGIAMRRLSTRPAREAIARAREAARVARIPALSAEVESAAQVLDTPAARLIERGSERKLRLEEVEALLASEALVVDACRHVVRARDTMDDTVVSLATRPVLFALARALAEAWPGDASREVLVAKAFRAKTADESHRARLRVEIGRLRAELRPLAEVKATARGFALEPFDGPTNVGRRIVVLARPADEAHGEVLAFLADGESWSSSALAVALGASQRTVQRALDALAAAGKVQSFGRGRSLRWMTPPAPGFTTTLLLPAPLPGG